MIFITGDTHGDQRRLGSALTAMRSYSAAEKYLIVCGDFGFLFSSQESEQEERFLDDLAHLHDEGIFFLFIDGNHENHRRLNDLPVETWNGGRVHFLRSNVIHLMRGEVFQLEGRTFFTFGGAVSTDQLYRREHFFHTGELIWWPEEQPTLDDYAHGRETFSCLDRVDYVLSHTAPAFAQQEMCLPAFWEERPLNLYLDEVRRTLDFSHWFFGHYHLDETCQVAGRPFTCVYRDVIPL